MRGKGRSESAQAHAVLIEKYMQWGSYSKGPGLGREAVWVEGVRVKVGCGLITGNSPSGVFVEGTILGGYGVLVAWELGCRGGGIVALRELGVLRMDWRGAIIRGWEGGRVGFDPGA